MKRKHRLDTELDTGTNLVDVELGSWLLATHGKKLRTIRRELRLCDGQKMHAREQKHSLIQAIKLRARNEHAPYELEYPDDEKTLARAVADCAYYFEVCNTWRAIQKLVREEHRRNWCWKRDLLAQIEEMQLLRVFWSGLSNEAKTNYMQTGSATPR